MKNWFPDRKVWMAAVAAIVTALGYDSFTDLIGQTAGIDPEQAAALVALAVAYFVPPAATDIERRK